MRIIFRMAGGRKRQITFDTWADACVWLKRWYPIIAVGNDVAAIGEDFHKFILHSAEILQ